MPKATSTTQSIQFTPDTKIAKLAFLGLVGFLFGCFDLFFSDIFIKSGSIFYEVTYNPRELAEQVIVPARDSLNGLVIRRRDSIKLFEIIQTKSFVDSLKLTPDSVLKIKIAKSKLEDLNKRDSSMIVTLSTYKNLYDNASNADTFSFSKLNDALHFQIEPYTINNWDSTFKKDKYNWTKSVNYYFKDGNINFPMQGIAKFKINHEYKADLDFFSKYPSATTWVLFILIFCTFCFIAVGTCIYLKKKIEEIFSLNGINFSSYHIKGFEIGSYWITCLLVFVSLTVLLIYWKITFYEGEIVRNIYFSPVTYSLIGIRIIGYLTGTLCLAGFIYSSSTLAYFVRNIKIKEKEIRKQRQVVNKALSNSIPESDVNIEQAVLDEKATENERNKNIFYEIYRAFNTYFILAATILTLLVLCTGALYNTVNSLDFVKLLTNDWGYSPVRNDFIYLYAGLHTIILLIVYIPAKMRFAEILNKEKFVLDDESKDNGFNTILQKPFSLLKDTLVVASPLLASLIQSLFDIVFNK